MVVDNQVAYQIVTLLDGVRRVLIYLNNLETICSKHPNECRDTIEYFGSDVDDILSIVRELKEFTSIPEIDEIKGRIRNYLRVRGVYI